MNARTPGPWTVERDTQVGLHTIWGDGNIILVARTCFAPSSVPNASLIAAAPDLLLALQAAAHALRSYQYGNGAPDLAADIAAHAEAVIAQVERTPVVKA
jgi:hypothetical protein